MAEEWDVKEFARRIITQRNDGIRHLFCEFMQELMDNGYANSLINDDDGHWTIETSGFQSVIEEHKEDEKSMTIQSAFYIEEGRMSDTIEGALRIWAQNQLGTK